MKFDLLVYDNCVLHTEEHTYFIYSNVLTILITSVCTFGALLVHNRREEILGFVHYGCTSCAQGMSTIARTRRPIWGL